MIKRPKLLYQYNALFYICNKFVRARLYVIFPENDSHASISLEKAFLYNTSFPRRSVYTEPKSKRILRKKTGKTKDIMHRMLGPIKKWFFPTLASSTTNRLVVCNNTCGLLFLIMFVLRWYAIIVVSPT